HRFLQSVRAHEPARTAQVAPEQHHDGAHAPRRRGARVHGRPMRYGDAPFLLFGPAVEHARLADRHAGTGRAGTFALGLSASRARPSALVAGRSARGVNFVNSTTL